MIWYGEKMPRLSSISWCEKDVTKIFMLSKVRLKNFKEKLGIKAIKLIIDCKNLNCILGPPYLGSGGGGTSPRPPPPPPPRSASDCQKCVVLRFLIFIKYIFVCHFLFCHFFAPSSTLTSPGESFPNFYIETKFISVIKAPHGRNSPMF